MAKYTKKQVREQEIKSETAKMAGIEKFHRYADRRDIKMADETYGLRKVCHKGNKTQIEAVNAISPTRGKGWIINKHGRRRTFVNAEDGYLVI